MSRRGGWRFGFVALLEDGTRLYGDMAAANHAAGANPTGRASLAVPANCDRLWLVVSGAPQEHWHHAWDDNDANDEQWPYQVKFANTNLLGEKNPPASLHPHRRRLDAGSFRLRDGRIEWLATEGSLEILDVRGRRVGLLGPGSGARTVALARLPKGILTLRTDRGSSRTLVNP